MNTLPTDVLGHIGSFLRVSRYVGVSRWTRDTWEKQAASEKWRARQKKISVPLLLRHRALHQSSCLLCERRLSDIIDLTHNEEERVFSRGPFCVEHTCITNGYLFEIPILSN